MSYSIKVLSNKEFDKLPYKRAIEALGVADPETNTAYVRYTAYPELNRYMIDHEFEHLVEEVPTDEEDGVRYKIPVAAALPAIGSLFGKVGAGALGAAKAGGGALLSGAGKLASGVGSLGQKAIGGLGRLPNIVKPSQYPIIGKTIGGAKNLLNYFNPFQSGTTGTASGLPQVAGIGNFFDPGGGPQFLSQQALQAQNAANNVSNVGSPLSEFFSKNKQNLFGAGSLAAGLLRPLPKAPELPNSVEEMRARLQQGGSPLNQKATGVLSSQLDEQFNPLSEPEIQAALRQLEIDQVNAEDQVRDLYRNLRPGSDPSSDTTFRQDIQEVQDQFARAKADTLATRTRDVKNQFDVNKRYQIQQALGADDQEFEQLSQIAQLDIYQIATQLGLDLQQAELFKNTFVNLGSDLLSPKSGLDELFSRLGGGNA